jgi:4-hydroxy-tetrahydrodipicolinate synthase
MIVPCGTTGEGATLKPAEADRVLSIVVEETSGRALVIFGAGSNSTDTAVEGPTGPAPGCRRCAVRWTLL